MQNTSNMLDSLLLSGVWLKIINEEVRADAGNEAYNVWRGRTVVMGWQYRPTMLNQISQ